LSVLLEKLLTPEEEELQRKQALLAGLEAQLADRELELAAFLADLVHFEKRYLQTVGRRYALLDELKAKGRKRYYERRVSSHKPVECKWLGCNHTPNRPKPEDRGGAMNLYRIVPKIGAAQLIWAAGALEPRWIDFRDGQVPPSTHPARDLQGNAVSLTFDALQGLQWVGVIGSRAIATEMARLGRQH